MPLRWKGCPTAKWTSTGWCKFCSIQVVVLLNDSVKVCWTSFFILCVKSFRTSRCGWVSLLLLVHLKVCFTFSPDMKTVDCRLQGSFNYKAVHFEHLQSFLPLVFFSSVLSKIIQVLQPLHENLWIYFESRPGLKARRNESRREAVTTLTASFRKLVNLFLNGPSIAAAN